VKRREFITILGGAAAAWPTVTRAQQPPLPVIGFLGSQSFDYYTDLFRAFRQGLKEGGYVDGENVTLVSRSAENHLDRLPALATELVRRPVTVIVTEAIDAALAAKAATAAVLIPFSVAGVCN
jgi:putative ABC transport system substrate-binding protein